VDAPAIARLAAIDPGVISGLIEERGAARVAAAGPEAWARDTARWAGVQEALDAAARGVQPAQRLDPPPRWLHGAATAAVERAARSWVGRGDVMTVRLLERLGLVELAHDDAYVLAVVGGLVGDPRFAEITRADLLRDDAELRDAVIWRLFEVEGGGEVSLANLDKFTPEPGTWSTTFHTLVEDGTLARADVLTAALGALARDFSAYRAGWYSRLYRSFEPTPAESGERQPMLRQLLRSEITATVTLALRSLLDVARAGQLDDDETAKALGPALQHETKTTADAALQLAEGIAKRRPDLADVMAGHVSVALAHPHAQVQERAGRLMQALGAGHRVADHAAGMSPAVALTFGVDGAQQLSRDEPPADRSTGVALPADAAVRGAPQPAAGAELVELMAALLEDATDPMAVESVLAGLARTGPTTFLASLNKRASTILDRGPRDDVTPGWLRGQLARLVRRSGGSEVAPLPWDWDGHGHGRGAAPGRHGALPFHAHRIDEVTDVLIGRRAPGRLLATPVSPAGWVRPGDLVAGFLVGATRPFDLVAALLRLGPDGRTDALADLDRRTGSASGLALTEVQAVRHALGAPFPRLWPGARQRLSGPSRALWVAAARARDPLGTDPWAERLGLHGAGRAVAIDLRLGVPAPWQPGGEAGPVDGSPLPWVVVNGPAPARADDQPTAITAADPRRFGGNEAEDYVAWVATMYPADAEHLCWVAGLDVVERALPYTEVRHDAVRVLEALRVHEGRVGRLTRAVLVAGLSAAGVDEKVRAADAVTQLAGAGRLDTAGLADGIVDVGPITPLPRLAGSLRDIASTGPSGSELVVGALGQALPQAPVAAGGVHALLEVLLDELVRTSRRTPAPMAPWLAQFRGASRAASLARKLSERL